MSFLFLLFIFFALTSLTSTQSEDYDEYDNYKHEEDSKYANLKKTWCGDDNCYTLLGVNINNDFREIKSAYNNLSLLLHPDKNPNQTDSDKKLYVKINIAWEILRDVQTRASYDEILRIKSKYDSPIESTVFVLILLYSVLVFVVLQYQKQRHREFRNAILSHVEIQRYFWDKHKIDLSGHRKKEKKIRKKNKRKSSHSYFGSGGSKNSGSNDKKYKGMQDIQQMKDGISNQMIDGSIEKCNILVPGWTPNEPTWKKSAMDIPKFVVWCFTESVFQISLQFKYRFAKRSMSNSDREELCRRHFEKSESEWNGLNAKSKQAFMDTPGKWNDNSGKVLRSRKNSSRSPKKFGKQN